MVGGPLLVRDRSAWGVTGVITVDVLLAPFESPASDVTKAVFSIGSGVV